MNDLIGKFIKSIEDSKKPLSYFFLTFIASVVLRTGIEIFSDRPYFLFKTSSCHCQAFSISDIDFAAYFIHYLFAWTSIFLAATILVHLLTKNSITKILKTISSISIFIICTPLVDLLLTSGAGIKTTYARVQYIVELFPFPPILSPGMLLTVAIAILAGGYYCYKITSRLSKGLLGAFMIYLLILLFSILPQLLAAFTPFAMIKSLTIIICLEIIVLLLLSKPRYLSPLGQNLKPAGLIHFFSMFVLGCFLAKYPFASLIKNNLADLILNLIAISLAWVFILMSNNIEESNPGQISGFDMPLINKLIPFKEYIKISYWILSACLLVSLAGGFSVFFSIILFIGCAVLYSLPPLKLKQVPILSKLLISIASLSLLTSGFLTSGKSLSELPGVIFLYFLIFVTLALNFIDISGYGIKNASGVRSLPEILGIKKAKLAVAIFMLLSYAALGLILLDFKILAICLIFGVTQSIFIIKDSFKNRLVLLTHFCFMAILFIYLNSGFWLNQK